MTTNNYITLHEKHNSYLIK